MTLIEGTDTMILKPKPVLTRQLHYDAAKRMYVGEISSTHGFGRVYDDACDVGLTLVGHTGREVVFVVNHTEYDADGDVMWWDLIPAAHRERGIATVHLFND